MAGFRRSPKYQHRLSQPGDVYIDGTPIPEGRVVFIVVSTQQMVPLTTHAGDVAIGPEYRDRSGIQDQKFMLNDDGEVLVAWEYRDENTTTLCLSCGQPGKQGHVCGWCGKVLDISPHDVQVLRSFREAIGEKMLTRQSEEFNRALEWVLSIIPDVRR